MFSQVHLSQGSEAEQGRHERESPAAFYQRLVGVLAPSEASRASTGSIRSIAQKQATRSADLTDGWQVSCPGIST